MSPGIKFSEIYNLEKIYNNTNGVNEIPDPDKLSIAKLFVDLP